MSTSQNNDTPSPHTSSSFATSHNGLEVSESKTQSPAEPVKRPNVEELDPQEVAKALQIAELLKKKPATAQKPKKEVAKPPSPPKAEFIPRRPPVPFSDNSNPDAIALRATTDLLQMQKAQAAQNIQLLEQLKEINRKDPLGFLKQLQAGKLKPAPSHQEGILGPTVGPNVDKLLSTLDLEAAKSQDSRMKGTGDEDMITNDERKQSDDEIPRFPTPQNIVRTPAINWSKYGIVGESLDKMHEEQKSHPSLGAPERLATKDSQPAMPIAEQHQYTEDKAEKFTIAAPYDPMKDNPGSKKTKKPY